MRAPVGLDIKLLGGLFLLVPDVASGWSIRRFSWIMHRPAGSIWISANTR